MNKHRIIKYLVSIGVGTAVGVICFIIINHPSLRICNYIDGYDDDDDESEDIDFDILD